MQQRTRHDPYAQPLMVQLLALTWRMRYEYLARLAKYGKVEICYVAFLEEAEEYCTSQPLPKMTIREAAPYGEVALVGHLPWSGDVSALCISTMLLRDAACYTADNGVPAATARPSACRAGSWDV